MRTVTLTNSFHGTSLQVRAMDHQIVHDQNGEVVISETWQNIQHDSSDRRLAGIKAKLCGSKDCTCGTVRA